MAPSLSTALTVGKMELKHRVVMSAMTRLRNDPETEAPRELNAQYYGQRASNGGLIIAEGASPSPGGRGYIRAPNLYDEPNLQGWRLVIDRIHAKGGFVAAQIMHAGRVSHSSLLPNKQLPVAPSAVKMAGEVHVAGGKAPYETPREATKEEIRSIVQEFAAAAKNAISVGFDAIELHGGNGYLLQEFLAAKTNQRRDEYGGSVENRARIVLEVVDACIAAIGADRVGIKLQQGVTFSDLIEPEDDSLAQLAHLGAQLGARKLAFVDLSSLNNEPYYKFVGLSEPNFKDDPFRFFRRHYKGTLIINGGLSPQKAEEYVADGTADAVAFGVLFLANANLPALIQHKRELSWAGGDVKIWYSKDPAEDVNGYTDWPLAEALEVESVNAA